MMYNIELYAGRILAYKGNQLILKNILKGIAFYGTGTIYNNENVQLIKYCNFTFFFIYRLKIKENNSDFDIKIINYKSWYYKVKIDDDIFEIKYRLFSFKKCCIIYKNNIEIGYVVRKFSILPRRMNVHFNIDNEEIIYNALIALLINLTNDEDT